MMIKILAFLFSFLSFSFQSEEPVSWKYNLNKIDSNQYNLTLDAEIIEGWKLYSQYSPVEGTATEFVFLTPNLSSDIKEKFDESNPIVGYDNVFDMDLPYFNNSTSFSKIIDLQDINLVQFTTYPNQ